MRPFESRRHPELARGLPALLWALGAVLLLATGCIEFNVKGEAPPPHPERSQAYTVIEQPDTGCTERPSPRRWAQMAYFFLDEGAITIPDNGRTHYVERGFLLYGGRRGSQLKDDLWLYDLTYRGFGRSSLASGPPGDLCPWFKMDTDATDTSGIYGGAMTIQGDDVVLVGGVVTNGSVESTTNAIYRASLHNLSAGFSSGGAVPSLGYFGAIASTGGCDAGLTDIECVDVNTHDHIEWGEMVSACQPELQSFSTCACLNGRVLESHCPQSPQCTVNDDYEYFVASAPGLAFMGIGDRNGSAFPVYGGITGCVGGACNAWVSVLDLYEPHQSNTPASASLEAFGNSSRPFVGYASSSFNVAPNGVEDMFASQAYRYLWETSMGVSHTAGVTLGMDFDHGGRTWAGSALRDLLVGGTYNQGVYPLEDHVGISFVAQALSCGDPPLPYSYWGSRSDWEIVDSPLSDTAPLTGLLAHDGWLLEFDEVNGGMAEIDSTLLGGARLDAAVARLEPESFLVVGGRGVGGSSDGTSVHVVSRVDNAGNLSADAVTNADDAIARYGANVVHDPMLHDAFYFGGRVDAEPRAELVMQVESSTGAAPNAKSEFTVVQSEIDLLVQDGAWSVDAAIKIRHDCEGDTSADKHGATTLRTPDADDCFAENVALVVPKGFLPTLPDPQVDMPDVTFTYLGTTGQWSTQSLTDVPLPVRVSFEAGAFDLRVVVLQLPKALTDGSYFSIRMQSAPTMDRPPIQKISSLPALHERIELDYGASGKAEVLAGGPPLWAARTVPEDPRYENEDITEEEAIAIADEWTDGTMQYAMASPSVRIDTTGTTAGWSGIAPGWQEPCPNDHYFEMLVDQAGSNTPRSSQARCLSPTPHMAAMFPTSFMMVLVDGAMIEIAHTAPASNRTVRAWYPTSALSMAANQRLFSYVDPALNTAGDLTDDVDWVAARLAANLPPGDRVPAGDVNLIYLPYGDNGITDLSALTLGAGMTILNAFAKDGTLIAEGPLLGNASSLEALTTHELAHQWTRQTRTCWYDLASCRDASWVKEGLAEYVEWYRYPGDDDAVDGPWDALETIIAELGATSTPDPVAVGCQDLEDPNPSECAPGSFFKRYQLGPYVVAQLHEMARSNQVDFWADAVPYLLTEESMTLQSEPLGFADVRDFVAMASYGSLAQTAVYVEMVKRDSFGTPLLGLTDWSYDPVTGIGSVEVSQVQVGGLDWPAFSVVPYYLGSVRLGGPGTGLAFNGTITGDANVGGHPTNRRLVNPGSVPRRLTVPSQVVGMAQAAANPFPADVALYANELMLAEWTPQRRSEGRDDSVVWYRVCDPAAPAACQPDNDDGKGDGYDDGPRASAPGSDCDPSDDTIHPMAPDIPGPWSGPDVFGSGTPDGNCDGWWGGLL